MSQLKKRKVYELLLYILSSVFFFYAIQLLITAYFDWANAAYHVFPGLIGFASLTYLSYALHSIFHPRTEKSLHLHYRVHGAISIGLGLVVAIITSVYISQKIISINEHNLTPIYPLDLYFIAAFLLGLGGYWLYKSFRPIGPETPYYPFISKKIEVPLGILKGVFTLFASYLFGGFLLGLIFFNNYSDVASQFFMIPYYLLMLAPAALLVYEEFFLFPKPAAFDEKKERRRWLIIDLIAIGLSLIAFLVIFVKPNLLLDQATSFFPLDHMGNIMIAPYLVTIPLLFYSLVLGLPHIVKKKEKVPEDAK